MPLSQPRDARSLGVFSTVGGGVARANIHKIRITSFVVLPTSSIYLIKKSYSDDRLLGPVPNP